MVEVIGRASCRAEQARPPRGHALSLGGVWLGMWAAYAFAGRPTPVESEAFKLVAALDMSMMVMALVVGGVLLWRKRPWGNVIAAIAGIQGALSLMVLSVNSLVAIERGPVKAPAVISRAGRGLRRHTRCTSILAAPLRIDDVVGAWHGRKPPALRDRVSMKRHGWRRTHMDEQLKRDEHNHQIVDLSEKREHIGHEVQRRDEVKPCREEQRFRQQRDARLADQA